MAVAKGQVRELYDTIRFALDPGDEVMASRKFALLLTELMKTEAYRRNTSFKQTVDRLEDCRKNPQSYRR